ncbi:hypothetical protein LOD99_11242 [Oopsacas minuta]|uniref:Uncharacterized protein n=1 Tax=Oopsacas minuta TaxID=111878 RepID=A0AAV7K6X7_9METZ|nr:hypothetical protein LOD99_11242 [Oopsacas minuta]
MYHTLRFLLFISVVSLATGHIPRDGVHELAKRRASKYELVSVTQLEGNQPMKSLSTHQGTSLHKHKTTFHLLIGNHDNRNATEMTIDLELNFELIASNFRFYSTNNVTLLHEVSSGYQHCYYHGVVRGVSGSRVSISTCKNGISGFIFDSTDLYQLEQYGDEGVHFMYLSEDAVGEGEVCGVAEDSPISHVNSFRQKLLRNRRDQANKFVEFYLVMDNAHYILTGSDTSISRQYAIEVANHMDFIYRSIGVRIALVGAEVWSTTDFITTSGDLDILLEQWVRYLPTLINTKADDGLVIDNAHIITGLSNSQSNVIGKAPLNSMCLSASGGVNRDTTGSLPTRIATTLSHEMGHNFGMNHDEGRACYDCPDENRGCVMNAFLRNPSPSDFSTCSVDDLHTALASGVGTCIYNPPPRLFTDPICGNAFVEEGEECDCGSDTECPDIDPCCQPGVCELYPWAECGSGDCCHNCTYSEKGIVCREQSGDCDIQEECNGLDNICPDNLFRRNGLECFSNGVGSFCYEGDCRTLLDQCNYVWGPDAGVADDICFDRVNILGDQYGNCGIDEQGFYKPCLPSNVKCGKLHCDVARDATPVLLGSYTVTYYQYPNAFCTAISISSSDMPDPGFVSEGTMCDTTSVCVMGVCTNVSTLPHTPCPVGNNGLECSGLTECSNSGVCVGLDIMIIPISHNSVVIPVVVMIIIVLAFVIAGVLIGYWLYKKRNVSSKPSTSTGRRSRGESLSEYVTSKFNSLPKYKNMPQFKNSVNTSESDPPPKPQNKPSRVVPRIPAPTQPPPRLQKTSGSGPPIPVKPNL